jgi:hypothetical protein
MNKQYLPIYSNLLHSLSFDTLVTVLGIISLSLGLTFFVIYNSFGPGSTKLIDPFEEDNK